MCFMFHILSLFCVLSHTFHFSYNNLFGPDIVGCFLPKVTWFSILLYSFSVSVYQILINLTSNLPEV